MGDVDICGKVSSTAGRMVMGGGPTGTAAVLSHASFSSSSNTSSSHYVKDRVSVRLGLDDQARTNV
jgi:hypothetical protein